ncbi:LacI family DNA-binding transcriptional regulator [Corynebacterium aquilae]|uniref:HTH lacI-type domain-containing protein n=1 Tax=Corynebacterium aquilae DSM 44791 TaxID=1431546 RepID=A0A1L7CEU8_9CORY|nr:LacI family DNA-binding transcriptional regulator [Corynebacterium aquilae]APT84381.1 hypothetical protein CAQU_04065 [Corynebacterium aquilae DSM 44791]
MRSATLRDVAQACGISISTVSRALAGHPKISEETKTRVETVAKRLNYRPNRQAQALRGSATQAIGLIVPGVGNQYFASLADVIQKQAAKNGLSLIMASSDDDPERLKEALDIMINQRIDGLIVVPHIGTEEVLQQLEKDGTPVVLVDRRFEEYDASQSVSLAYVDSDPEPGIFEAVKLLAKNGRKVGYLAGPQDTSTGIRRLQAFNKACSSLGVTGETYNGGYEEEQGFQGAGILLDRGCTNLLAGDSMMTVGALRKILAEELQLGKDICLVGFDDFPVFELQETPITIIDQDVRQMGKHAFSLLYEKMSSVQNHQSIEQKHQSLPTKLVLRASTPMEVEK